MMIRAALGIWILSAVICSGRGDHHYGHHASDHAEQDTVVDNSVSLVTSANKEFAYRLYRKLAAHPDSQGKNVFFSPASVSVALAALAVGARGDTHQQLFNGLGYTNTELTQANVDQAFQALLQKSNESLHEDISAGTAVFVDDDFKPNPEFLDTLRQSYLSEGFSIDFSKTTESENTINKYVEDKTHGKINKLVESLDPQTVMYLISYIYFKGKWATPFESSLTREAEFNVDENTKVPVQMMNMEETVDTYHDQAIHTTVLHLPFNSSYSMLLLLPDDMATLESSVCSGHVTKWLKWKKSSTHDIYVPKFSTKSSYSLREVLTEMGMTDVFGDNADLSGISEGKLAVSEVVHQATLDIDEVGAEAAGVTGIGITLTSLRHVPVLKFNKPFMVIITERETQDVLFMGKIVNPNI